MTFPQGHPIHEKLKSGQPIRLLFVCLGNICRSPLAEGVFLHLAEAEGVADAFEVDSAGTGDWHVGSPPDDRSIRVARAKGIRLPSIARQVARFDFEDFDLVLGMDHANHRDLLRLAPRQQQGKVRLLREWDPDAAGDLEVPDPYYGGIDGFENVLAICQRSCSALLAQFREMGG